MRHDQLLIVRGSGGRQRLCELLQTKRRDDGHDVRVVREIKVQGLVEREGRVRLVESGVDVGRSGGEIVQVVRETGVQLLDVAYTDATAGRGSEAVVAIELQVDAVLEALPFFIGEEFAPVGVSLPAEKRVSSEMLVFTIGGGLNVQRLPPRTDTVFGRCNYRPPSSYSLRKVR